ncbi:formyltransferase family protein [Streptomyces sp. MH60]|uniref:formyltransferase family protein n=1 Tax=Streptomyces sp. MH60 TaxID=1940758 RepID=UPI000CEE4C09|nr:formyltransferase family protein [Streptomyces sp. MH60]
MLCEVLLREFPGGSHAQSGRIGGRTARTVTRPLAPPAAPVAGGPPRCTTPSRFVLVPALREELEVPVPADRHPCRAWNQGPALAVVPAPRTERPAGIGCARILRAYQPDAAVSYGYPRKLPASAVTAPRLGTVNCHPSDLPAYRGPNPVGWAVRNGEREIGVTWHRLDTGAVPAHTRIPLDHSLWSFTGVNFLVLETATAMLPDVLGRLALGEKANRSPRAPAAGPASSRRTTPPSTGRHQPPTSTPRYGHGTSPATTPGAKDRSR